MVDTLQELPSPASVRALHDLSGCVVLVTGGGSGLGRAMAWGLACYGADCAIVDRDGGLARECAKEIEANLGRRAIAATADVSSEGDVERAVGQVLAELGRIDVLINNAAIFYGLDHRNYTYEYLRKIFDVNYFGTWLMSRAVFPRMKAQNDGVIINQSSTAAYMHPNMLIEEEMPSFHYSVTKAAINALTHYMAGCLGIYGIRVNAISPGPTMTEATKQGVPQEMLDMIVQMMMAIKRPLQPDDLTGTAVWLASDDAKMVTGQVIPVDGGMWMVG
jgi:3-oxoacyl-[acyl-carrier protein] reductase